MVFIGTADCRITNCIIEGGPKKGRDKNPIHPCSRYFGVFFVGTHGLMIQGNHFKPFKGRAQWQWITSSSRSYSHHASIVGNVFEGAFDHPIYCSGIVKSVVSNNTTRDTIGTAIKLIGADLVVTGNNIYNARYGGIETRNASRCIVTNNLVDGFGHNAIEISLYGGGKTSHTDNIVQGNILIGFKDKAKPPVMSGVYISSRLGVSRCKVVGNIIHNSGNGNPELDAKLPGEPAIRASGATS